MDKPVIPDDERARIQALHSLELLDTPPEERFDRITRIARAVFKVPIALVSLVDEDRQWFKARAGLDAAQTSREVSFCGHAILASGVFVVEDALEDERFADNPLVTGPPHVRFYAGAPIPAREGSSLGTLCIIDTKPRKVTSGDRTLLRDLGDVVGDMLVRTKG
ncbi:MAG: GAF domain-containing protein [Deltaproteobacteria bacterium]|jgi:GAF domain-containing protein|nr:GAF domain-containing protein [Deltaproteobacteria bacterium]